MSLKRQLLDNLPGIAAILFIAAVSIVLTSYVLLQQRVPNPFKERYTVKVAFAGTAGLTPGAGQPVNVAGVQVGQVGAVELRDGRSIVSLTMNKEKLPTVFADAKADLIPRTPLKDLQVELFPGTRGSRPLAQDAVIPVSRTTIPIDADELLAALDGDTRQYLEVLLAETDRGIGDRGPDLRRVLAELKPTAKQLASLTKAVRGRRVALRGLVHELSIIAEAAGEKDTELASLVTTGNATLQALAAEQQALRSSVRDLPGTLRRVRGTLQSVEAFTAELNPALQRLQVPAKRIVPALRALDPVTEEAPGILRTQLRPLVREARPLVRELRPAATELTAAVPDLVSVVKTVTYVVNELAFNPEGDDEGYLYWLAWFGHNGASFLSTQDANGPAWRGMGLLSCSAVAGVPDFGPMLNAVLGQLPLCGDGT